MLKKSPNLPNLSGTNPTYTYRDINTMREENKTRTLNQNSVIARKKKTRTRTRPAEGVVCRSRSSWWNWRLGWRIGRDWRGTVPYWIEKKIRELLERKVFVWRMSSFLYYYCCCCVGLHRHCCPFSFGDLTSSDGNCKFDVLYVTAQPTLILAHF